MNIRNYKGNSLHPLIKEKIESYSSNILPNSIDTLPESYMGSYLYNDDEEIVGGITGHAYWNILHVDYFWVDERYRGNGIGTELLKSMENLAKDELCKYIHLETFSFEAPAFYEKNNYEVFGVIEDAPIEGVSYYFFKKEL